MTDRRSSALIRELEQLEPEDLRAARDACWGEARRCEEFARNCSDASMLACAKQWDITAARLDAAYQALLVVAPPPSQPETELAIAERIARQAHEGQKEESTGDDYIHHIERVVALVASHGDKAQAVAWLHDVLEDTALTCCDLTRAGISADVVNAVTVLTRRTPDTYAEYIADVRVSTPLAIAVKIADLRDHLRPNCPERLRPRYKKALAELSGVVVSPPSPPETEDGEYLKRADTLRCICDAGAVGVTQTALEMVAALPRFSLNDASVASPPPAQEPQ